jgi:hypothetical protein
LAAPCRAVDWTLKRHINKTKNIIKTSANMTQKIRSKAKKQNTTQNQQQIQNINAHQSFAFTSALFAISSSHTAG